MREETTRERRPASKCWCDKKRVLFYGVFPVQKCHLVISVFSNAAKGSRASIVGGGPIVDRTSVRWGLGVLCALVQSVLCAVRHALIQFCIRWLRERKWPGAHHLSRVDLSWVATPEAPRPHRERVATRSGVSVAKKPLGHVFETTSCLLVSCQHLMIFVVLGTTVCGQQR